MSAERRRGGSVIVISDLPAVRDLGVDHVYTADAYLEGQAGTAADGLTVINLCRSYQYRSRGYYVSLLADARHQRIVPSLETVQAINDPFVYFRKLQEAGLDTIDYRIARGGHRLLPRLIIPEPDPTQPPDAAPEPLMTANGDDATAYQRAPAAYREITSVLGRTAESAFRRICSTIFKVYPVPLLRIRLYWEPEEQAWEVGQIFPAPFDGLTPEDVELLGREIGSDRLRREAAGLSEARPFRIACLFDETDPYAPSDEETLEKFERAAMRRNALFEIIGREDMDSLAEYDALFIRTVTAIDHYAFTFSRTAESLDIPVIDDPRSIMRCSNKVFLHELFQKQNLRTPRTLIISRKTPPAEIAALGFPLILKQPDGTFSAAVKKAGGVEELEAIRQDMFRRSPLLIAQEFTPTAFDWRIGVLDGKLLFAARYHMVKDHWQIVGKWSTGRTRYGRVEAVPIPEVPPAVTALALEACALIGDGLYGVDIKETPDGPAVIEVNDNPNIMEGDEDAVEHDRVYDAIIATLLARIRSPQEREPAS